MAAAEVRVVTGWNRGGKRSSMCRPTCPELDIGTRLRWLLESATRRARRANLRRDAGRLESVRTCRLGLSRFVSAGAVLGTEFV
jgi:hypothetical protein